MRIIYRVIIRINWYDAFFEFDDMEKACSFANSALTHMVDSKDTQRKSSITVLIVDVDKEAEENRIREEKEAAEKAAREAEKEKANAEE